MAYMSFKKILLILVVFSCTTTSFAQDRLLGKFGFSKSSKARNLVYLELGGKGLFYSVNYERALIKLNDDLSINPSIGFSLWPGFTQVRKTKDYMLPLALNLVKSFDEHNISFGVGSTYYNYMVNDLVVHNNNLPIQPLEMRLKTITEWFGHVNLEYRYQKEEGGLMFKAGVTTLFFDKMQNFKEMHRVALSGNIGVGYAF